MKKILLLISLFVSVFTFAQNKGITYQAVIYSTNGESIPGIHNSNSPMVNKAICLQFSIVDENTQTEYQEKVTVATDDFGMVNLVIGNGTQTAGYASSFNTIVWTNAQKYLKVSLDQSGNCSAFEEISNQVLTYVPFALAANSATTVSGVVSIAHGGTNSTTLVGAKTNLQLQNVDNTSDLNKPLSTASQTALNTKVDKVTGKDLSSNDYTTAEKTKLASLGGTQDLSLYATNANLALKAPLASPNFTGIMGLNNRAEFGQNIEREQPSLKLIGYSKSGTGVNSFWPTQPYAGGGLEIGDGGAVRLVIYRKSSNSFNISTTGSLHEGIGINADGYDPAYTLDINGTLGVRNSITSMGTITAGSVTYPNVDGTSGQVLATNGAGVAAWTSPSSSSGSNFVDLNSNQTIAGSKTFSSNVIANLSGNATSATNIEGGSIGQLPYQNSSNITSFLSPNTSNTRKFLSSVGSNGGAIAPSWQPLSPSDIVSSSSQTAGYLNFETGVFSAQNWTELNTQWTITSGWANTRNYNGTSYQGAYSIIAPDSQDFTLQSSKDFNLASLYIKGDGMQTATSIEFKGYNAAGSLVGTVIANPASFNYNFSNVSLNLNGIRKLVFHPVGYDPNAMGGGNFFLDYFDVSILTSNNLNSVNGILKSDGNGTITAAIAGSDYLNSSSLSGYLSLTGGNLTGQLSMGTSSPQSSAVLDVSSTTQGFLPPRMTQSQRNTINNPVAGLVVWCKNCGANGELQVYNGTTWTNMIGGIASVVPINIGDSYGGGTVIYLFQSGNTGYVAGQFHGIIIANDDAGYSPWGCSGTTTNATGTVVGSATQNTANIIASNCSGTAAQLCVDYRGGGYSDWSLPSIDELNIVFTNRSFLPSGLSQYLYWSSSETSSAAAYRKDMRNTGTGSAPSFGKTSNSHVRAVRYF